MATESSSERAPLPNAEFIERCQIEYDRNPGSRVFAPLCEAYRRMGLLKEAFEIASRGVRLHPDFAAGRIAFARLLIEKKSLADAVEQLARAAELSPDNLLAFQLLGETYLELRRPKDALAAFKMVLFLNPLHERAQAMVRKWEFLSADDYEDRDFEWAIERSAEAEQKRTVPPDGSADPEVARDKTSDDKIAYRSISIADALTVRNDLDGALSVLGRTLRALGPRPDLEQRLSLLGRRLGLGVDEMRALAYSSSNGSDPAKVRPREIKRQKLEKLLKRIQAT